MLNLKIQMFKLPVKMRCSLSFCVVLLCCGSSVNGQQLNLSEKITAVNKGNIFQLKDYYVWCPSIIKDPKERQYHLFYSRWPKKTGFGGWLFLSEVGHAISKTPYGPWEDKGVVFRQNSDVKAWDALDAHNPRIHYFNGKYYLYYIGTHFNNYRAFTQDELEQAAQLWYKSPYWMEVRNNQRTGVAVSKNIGGPWKRLPQPIIQPSGPIKVLTVNPTIAKGADKKYYLIVKGDRGKAGGFRNQAVAVGKTPVGPFVMQEKPAIGYMNTEDMAMWYSVAEACFYSVFHNDNIIYMVASKNGIDWDKAQNFEVLKPKIAMDDGTYYQPKELQRPYVFVENDKPSVLAVATRNQQGSEIICIPLKK